MVEDFSPRMAARIAAEDQMAEEGAAAGEDARAAFELSGNDESADEQEVDHDEQQQSNEQEVPGTGEPQKTPSKASSALGRV